MSTIRKSTEEHRYPFDIVTDTSVVEVKRHLKANRSLRDTLVQLVAWLARSPGRSVYLLLIDPGITDDSLRSEITQFQAALRHQIADRLGIVVARDGRIASAPPSLSDSLKNLIMEQVQTPVAARTPIRRASMQSEVMRVVILDWITCGEPLTLDYLGKTVGCSYRTARAAIDWLGPAVEQFEDRRVRLKYFPTDAWAQFIAMARHARNTINYVDRSSNPRSPDSLVRRLRDLTEPAGVAVGGVFGATHHYRDLDIVGSPRLDLTIHVPGDHVDIGFVERLDPSLTPAKAGQEPVRVALHFVRRKEALFDADDDGRLWADPVECLADLFEARLDHQAMEFQRFITQMGEGRGGRN